MLNDIDSVIDKIYWIVLETLNGSECHKQALTIARDLAYSKITFGAARSIE
jgi:hypothetical protein